MALTGKSGFKQSFINYPVGGRGAMLLSSIAGNNINNMISDLDKALENMTNLWFQARAKGDQVEMRLFKSIGIKLRALQHARDNPQTNIDTYNSAKNIFDATPVDK
jgi:hypothetical protein